jgi:hypothetical protein
MATLVSREQWFRFHEAVALVRQRRPGSIGKTEALVRAAAASGEVRSLARGVEDYSQGHRRVVKISVLNKDDLLDWLDRHEPRPQPAETKPIAMRKQNKRDRAKAAAQSIWGTDGPPSHLENSVICKEVCAEFKKRGEKANMDDATILRAVGRKN